jgi:hypothetical protein
MYLDHTYTQSVGILSTGDQLVAQNANYTTNKWNKIPCRQLGFEPAKPTIMRHHTYALDRMDTGIGSCLITSL